MQNEILLLVSLFLTFLTVVFLFWLFQEQGNGGNASGAVVDTATTCVTRENMFEPECQRMLFSFD